MREIPILYSAPMAIAKREGRKTQTRRIIKPQPSAQLYHVGMGYYATDPSGIGVPYIKCPFGEAGDVLWGRETWCYAEDENGNHTATTNGDCFGRFLFRANGDRKHDKWKPSIFMPKSAAQIWERVVDVRVERLQEISEEDAIAEGIEHFDHVLNGGELRTMFKNYKNPDTGYMYNAVASYATLWESINGAGSWEANPFVWVIETEILSTTGRPKDL